ncbi:MAG: peptide deformylase [Clostridiales bacterium]|nr:peptide deformylase [Clostridiales bacterium]
MAIRNIVKFGDDTLRKTCKPVDAITKRTKILIEDMLDTMYNADGVGLAAPQVGVLRRVCVIDVGNGPVVMINPVITSTEGEQTGTEGCLSNPGKYGTVTRPAKVTATAMDENGEVKVYEAEGLFARAICHELDHLDGVVFTDKVTGDVISENN